MYLKLHNSEESTVVAVCDKSLLGKIITEGEKELNISEDFYKGELKNKEEVIEILKQATNANLIGEESISCGIEAKIISEENIIEIKGVKHAQFYNI
jgi:uncharacterized protein